MAFVDGNVSTNRQIGAHLGVGSGQDNRYRRDYARLKILYDRILYQLRPPMIYYNEGEFEYFMESTPDILIYTRLLNNDSTFYYNNEAQLDQYKYDERLVENYRFVSNRVIDTIKQAMTEYIKIRNLTRENEELKSYKEILEDGEKLSEYLETRRNTRHLFSAEATLEVAPTLKLWYQVYFERHEPPGDGVFNSEFLAEIIEELIQTGQITEEELIF
jgi:hypothetical protein